MIKPYEKCNFAKLVFLPNGREKAFIKIDTGAGRTILNERYLKYLKPKAVLTDGEKINMVSASGHEINGYKHNVFIKFENAQYGVNMNIVFCNLEKSLLGIDSIQKHFKSVTFGPKQYSISF